MTTEERRRTTPPAASRLTLEHVYTFRPRDQAVHATTRLAFFSDAILAIAATVLVLNLTVVEDTAGHGLAHQVYVQRATLVSILLGFLWISGTWVLSHRSLRQLRGVDHYMTLLVLAGTLSITLIPFATLMLARGYGHHDFWIGVEAVSLVSLVGVLFSALATYYARRRDLLLRVPTSASHNAAMVIWYTVIAMVVAAVLLARFAPWLSLTLVVLTRLSAVMPLSSDRAGLAGDLGALEPGSEPRHDVT